MTILLKNWKAVIFFLWLSLFISGLFYSFYKIKAQGQELKAKSTKIKQLEEDEKEMLQDLKISASFLRQCKDDLQSRENDYKSLTDIFKQKEKDLSAINKAYKNTMKDREFIKCEYDKTPEKTIIKEIYKCPDMKSFAIERNKRVDKFNKRGKKDD